MSNDSIKTEACEWSLVFGDPKAYWQSGCGKQSWFSEERNPRNESYCCHCGKKLTIGVPTVSAEKARKALAMTRNQLP